MDNNSSNDRILYLDILRIFSIFCMMMIHILFVRWSKADVTSFEWQVINVYECLVRFCVPAFVMISGVFFLDPKRQYTIKKLFHKNILRIVSAFVFWSASYSIAQNVLKYKTINLEICQKILRDFVIGHYHLWFLFTLFGLYLIVPFLKKICENKTLMQYFLILSFFFTFVVNMVSLIPQLKNTIRIISYNSNIFFVLGYSGYFLLGSYLYRFELPKKAKTLIYALGIISVVATILGSSFLSINQNKPCKILYENLLLNTYFESMAVFLFFKDKISKIKFSTKSATLIQGLSKLTFGMYLVHEFVNVLFAHSLNLTTACFNPIFSAPIISALVFVISLCITYIISKIPILNKYII